MPDIQTVADGLGDVSLGPPHGLMHCASSGQMGCYRGGVGASRPVGVGRVDVLGVESSVFFTVEEHIDGRFPPIEMPPRDKDSLRT